MWEGANDLTFHRIYTIMKNEPASHFRGQMPSTGMQERLKEIFMHF